MSIISVFSITPMQVSGQSHPAPPPPIAYPTFLTVSLRDGLDTTVSPCTDFDQYVNGGWRERTTLPDGMKHLDVFTVTQYRTQQFLDALLDSARRVATTATDVDLRVVGNYYASCLTADSLETMVAIASMVGAAIHDTSRIARCKRLVMRDVMEALEQLFVRAVIPQEVIAQVRHLLATLRDVADMRLQRLSWVSTEAKAAVDTTLTRMTLKVAAPDTMIDHSSLILTPTDFFANWRAVQSFSHLKWVKGIGNKRQPVWNRSQYNPNASYRPATNSIEVPAFMFQPPFFNAAAEAAASYAGIGVVISHEINHGITLSLRKQDTAAFNIRARRLVEQYDALPPINGAQVNGAQTLIENLADLGGMLAAYEAWQRTSRASAIPLIEGFTPEQRFFLYYARVWRAKLTTEYVTRQVAKDAHAPKPVRINGVLMNVPAFAQAFGCRDGDPMAKPAAKRADIW